MSEREKKSPPLPSYFFQFQTTSSAREKNKIPLIFFLFLFQFKSPAVVGRDRFWLLSLGDCCFLEIFGYKWSV